MNALLKTLALTLVTTSALAGQLQQGPSVVFLEGPAWRTDGVLFFSDIPNSRIMRWDGSGPVTVHRSPAGHANGLAFDSAGRLVIAEDDGRLMREELDGRMSVLSDKYQGRHYNALNDLFIDSKDRIFFTDPAYNNRESAPQRDEDGAVVDGVYRRDPNGHVTRLLDHQVNMPNGIAISPNEEFIYIADNDGKRENGVRVLWRFALDAEGNIDSSSKKQLFNWGNDRGPDGITVDHSGNIYVAAGRNYPHRKQLSKVYKAGVYKISPDGALLDFIAVPADPVTNLTFGGADGKTLFITAGAAIWTLKLD